MDEQKVDTLKVTLDLDVEELPALQGALAYMADICKTYGLGYGGEIRKEDDQNRHYGEALSYILYIAAEIGAAVLDAHI